MSGPRSIEDPDAMADAIIERVGKRIVLALPLGLGKAVGIVNALTRRAIDRPDLRLSIFTALTLERPAPSGDMQRRFLEPAMDRLFGRYPALLYAQMLRRGTLPDNVQVREFFLVAGQWLGVAGAQQSFISTNYTDALDVLLENRPNVIAQLVARDSNGAGARFSLSCNPDITVDLLEARREGRADFVVAAEVNEQLPFMFGDAVVAADEIDLVLDGEANQFELYSAPKRALSTADHMTGLHVSRLIRDGGSLQIGIGSIGDAVANALVLRHQRNATYREMTARLALPGTLSGLIDEAPFETGLYGVTEMLVDGFLRLAAAGIVNREVDGAIVHAGFFVESRSFYETLRRMAPDRRARFCMVPISFTNALYGDETAKRRARVSARFVNSAMKATLLGAVVSDGLDDGQVVSGVGGQSDFVTQAFALDGARSMLTLNATRMSGGRCISNVVWNYAHTTIAKQHRDIIVTEYGAADLRGRTDAEVIAAMLSIADSRFQAELLDRARSAGKLASDFVLPESWRSNTPERVEELLAPYRRDGQLPAFPFGTDLDVTERRLLPALEVLKHRRKSRLELAKLAWRGRSLPPTGSFHACLARMGYSQPGSLGERFRARLLHGALIETRNAFW